MHTLVGEVDQVTEKSRKVRRDQMPICTAIAVAPAPTPEANADNKCGAR